MRGRREAEGTNKKKGRTRLHQGRRKMETDIRRRWEGWGRGLSGRREEVGGG